MRARGATKSPRLRARLTVLATASFALALVAVAVPLDAVVRSSVLRGVLIAADRELERVERLLASGREPALFVSPEGVVVQVRDGSGRFIAASAGGAAVISRDGRQEIVVETESARLPTGSVTAPFDPDELPPEWVVVGRDSDTRAQALRLTAAAPAGEALQTMRTIRFVAALAAPALLGLVAWLLWVVSGRALRPMGDMAAAASAMEPGQRLAVPGNARELAELATRLNLMLDRLDAFARRQQRFVADAAHELRTPLATIRSNLELAARADSANDHVTRALRHEARLEALIDDLLALARLDEGSPLPTEVVDMSRLVREHLAGRDGDTEAVVPDGITVVGNRTLLGRLAANLIDNAERHRRSRSLLTLQAGDRVTLTLDDDGLGIPEADRERVFERFVRLDEARDKTTGGAGLGLALCRGIVERHGGHIRIEDSHLGGARLVAELPVAWA